MDEDDHELALKLLKYIASRPSVLNASQPEWMKGKRSLVTPETAEHLKSLGFEQLPDWIEVYRCTPEEEAETIYVCGDYEEGEELKFSDNHIGHCAWCNRWVQFRPNSPKRIQHVCPKCAEQKARQEEH